MRLSFLFLCVCLASTVLLNAQTTYEKGKIHDSIAVSGAKNESFALYLPSSFSENRLNPIVFIYEPMGRGAIGIPPFLSAAEKYGLILVCSNNSRNGPYEHNFAVANNLFSHVFSHFNIKDDEIYASGFSGGSRLASAIASLTNRFAGVVGCGAGFSGLQEQMPSAQNYAYVGLCGDRDMNYIEMLTDKDYLGQIKFNSTLITFSGGHNWPPQEQLLRAFDWLYLQRFKRENPLPQDQILEYYRADYALLEQLKSNNDQIFAAEQYERMLKDYSGFVQNDSIMYQYHIFKNSVAYKKKASALNNALNVEEKLMDKFRSRFTEEFENGDGATFKWWEKELAKLKSLVENKDIELQKMADRVIYDLFARAYVRKSMLLQASDTYQIAQLTRLLEMIRAKK